MNTNTTAVPVAKTMSGSKTTAGGQNHAGNPAPNAIASSSRSIAAVAERSFGAAATANGGVAEAKKGSTTTTANTPKPKSTLNTTAPSPHHSAHDPATMKSMSVSEEGFSECTVRGGEGEVEVHTTFDTMPLDQRLHRGIYSYGYERPTPIQQRAIVPMIGGHDIIAQAQAGTGKTGAFVIGLLQQLRWGSAACGMQGLILAPTRELAEQTYSVTCALGEYLGDGPFCRLLIGGTKLSDDCKALQALNPTVVVATPGRVADLIRRGALRTSAVRCLILDEADEMLSQGFAEQVQQIFSYVPRDVQVALFSATLPPEVLQLSGKFMRDPTRILLRPDALTLNRVKQYYVAVDEPQKLDCVMDLYESISVAQSVIFVNSRAKVEWVAQQLNANHHSVSALHAELPRAERSSVMRTFRSGATRVLVTSDLVCRGIDVEHVNVVMNYDLPRSKESYLHRIGRSGRCGKKGIAINLVSVKEVPMLREIEAHYKTKIDELPMDFAAYFEEKE